MLMLAARALATALFIVIVAEIAKRSTLLAGILVAMPLATIMTVGLTYLDTRDAVLSTRFATTTFAMFWPGLLFFISLPLLQRFGAPFWVAYGIAILLVLLGYAGMILLLRRLGVQL